MVALSVRAVLVLVCAINFLNFVDRGLIPGAPIEFQGFVQATTQAGASVSVYVGVLQTSFIASFSVFVCVFGHLATTHAPFTLTAVGLSIWIVALACCGLAKTLDSFPLLLAGRLVSGIGEASFQATAPSFIDAFAIPSQRTRWLGLFYAAAPIGEAVGFSFGSIVAASVGWDAGFYTIALLAVPLAVACYACIPPALNCPLGEAPQDTSPLLIKTERAPTTFLQRTLRILQSPLFLTSSLGSAALSFTLDGLATFAPVLYIGMGVLDATYAASAVGAIVVGAGLLGPLIGGHLLDMSCRGHELDDRVRQRVAAWQLLLVAVTSTGLLFLSLACIGHNRTLVLAFLFLGLVLAFSASAPSTVLILLSVSYAQRGYAMGLNTLLTHVLGDVPAGVVLGALKDVWAPHCGSVLDAHGADVLNPNCHFDFAGLRATLGFAYCWLGWAIIAWAIAYWFAAKRGASFRV
ncbi:hypothetical protein SPRG_01575 [Saprolegnia parasitica CBS 223.65]|uniref:Major facilitator superfamily (MFS) profile domain-containing protein n=1 Tax=Saprolegnia parasitica (strain CBS 223.65) TaxID=695850 RepID=A0A067D6W9_SAPPC|nr:hypothetical protein SPRG_01575 [Saprolegnia parasitica CBS 223.65]KDO34441.1 hypothetical protein SPRG_01575 [Saprolegnia parasitica CBS 223.65]|eukprot:XP_012195171.1 hypothetical protein SPRG_01575 [Saprolegnia parasitica CBS 223.65]